MKLPFVFSLPHNSNRIPDPIRSSIVLSPQEIWESVDMGTEEIFGGLPGLGVVRAQWSRLVVDVNRGLHQRGTRGVVPRVDYRGRSVYRDGMAPQPDEMDRRITRYYNPYHARLQHALSVSGLLGLFDCHSLFGIGPEEAPDTGSARPDIILGNNGDRSGNPTPHLGTVTCPPEVLRMMENIFKKSGFSVSLNHPYSGGFITTHYGEQLVAAKCFAVQIEINQDLYMPSGEQRLLSDKIDQTRENIFQSLDHIAGNL